MEKNKYVSKSRKGRGTGRDSNWRLSRQKIREYPKSDERHQTSAPGSPTKSTPEISRTLKRS